MTNIPMENDHLQKMFSLNLAIIHRLSIDYPYTSHILSLKWPLIIDGTSIPKGGSKRKKHVPSGNLQLLSAARVGGSAWKTMGYGMVWYGNMATHMVLTDLQKMDPEIPIDQMVNLCQCMVNTGYIYIYIHIYIYMAYT